MRAEAQLSGAVDARKVGFSLSDCCRGSNAFVFRQFGHHQTAICSVACDASSDRGGLDFGHAGIAKLWVSPSGQKETDFKTSLGFCQFVCENFELRQRGLAEAGGQRHVGGIASAPNQNPPNPWHIVARVERVPST